MQLDSSQLKAIRESIQQARAKICWKPGKALPLLAKRIRLGHLPEGTTLEKYEEIISSVLNQPDAQLYLFVYGSSIYPTAIALVAESASAPLSASPPLRERVWLVMLGLDGVLETGFPPESPESYLADDSFIYLGLLQDLVADHE